MKEGSLALVLVDQDTEQDRRVLFFIALYQSLGLEVELIDVRNVGGQGYMFSRGVALLNLSIQCIRNASKLACFLRRTLRSASACPTTSRAGDSWIRYFKTAYKETIGSFLRGAAWRRSAYLSERGRPSIVHANDLRCLAFAAGARLFELGPVIYDSHELNLFRNRPKQSRARLCLNAAIEYLGTRKVKALFAVSPPIANALQSWYGVSMTVVVPNNFYPRQLLASSANLACEDLHIIYVGAVNSGRGLEKLLRIAEGNKSVHVHIFAFGEPEGRDHRLNEFGFSDQSENISIHRPSGADIDQALTQIVEGNRYTFFWCYIEPICMSYRLALPNKFFQAMSFGVPIIAAGDTYLGDYVARQRLGVVATEEQFANASAIAGFVSTVRGSAAELRQSVEKWADQTYATSMGTEVASLIRRVTKEEQPVDGFDSRKN